MHIRWQAVVILHTATWCWLIYSAKSRHQKIDNEKNHVDFFLLHQHADVRGSSQIIPSFHMNGKIAIASRYFMIDLEPMKWPKEWEKSLYFTTTLVKSQCSCVFTAWVDPNVAFH